MEIYYIIYSSTPVNTINDDNIRELLITSRHNNGLHAVTGMLICLPELFIQLIEGPEDSIKQLYVNIQKDRRHKQVTLLKAGYAEQRHFPNWTMGADFPSLNEDEKQSSFSLSDRSLFQLFDILQR